jgi:hypothetical protein
MRLAIDIARDVSSSWNALIGMDGGLLSIFRESI